MEIDEHADGAAEFLLGLAHEAMHLTQAVMGGVAHVDAENVGARLEQGLDRLFVVGGRTEGGDDLDPAIAPH